MAGTVGGVIGFGTSIMLMPALVLVFGPREAVPIMAGEDFAYMLEACPGAYIQVGNGDSNPAVEIAFVRRK